MLPLAWIDELFARLAVRYGSAWTAKWRDLDVAAVKSDWCCELAGFERHPTALTYALENLPPAPPTVTEFRAIARRAPAPDIPRLERPTTGDPQRVRAELAELRGRMMARRQSAGRDWARRAIARHEAGERVAPITLRFAREALGIKLDPVYAPAGDSHAADIRTGDERTAVDTDVPATPEARAYAAGIPV